MRSLSAWIWGGGFSLWGEEERVGGEAGGGGRGRRGRREVDEGREVETETDGNGGEELMRTEVGGGNERWGGGMLDSGSEGQRLRKRKRTREERRRRREE